MNPIIEYLTGMNVLTDQIIAMDLLISAKNGVRNYAMAATEAGTPEVKEVYPPFGRSTRYARTTLKLYDGKRLVPSLEP